MPPWDKYQAPASAPKPAPAIVDLPESPQQKRDNARQDRRDDRADAAAARAAEAANRAAEAQAAATALAREKFDFDKSQAQAVKLSPKERSDAIAAYTSAESMDKQIAEMERLFQSGPGATSGITGIKDYIPLPENTRFNKAANAARGDVGALLGFTGGQLNSIQEAEQAVGPYLPSAKDSNAEALDKIQRLKDLSKRARSRSIAILGGVPDANGVITPVTAAQPAQGAQPPQGPTPLNGMVYQSEAAKKGAGWGAETKLENLPEGYQSAVDAYIRSPGFTPEGYAALRGALDKTVPLPEGGQLQDNTAAYEQYARDVLVPTLQHGGTIPDVPGVEKKMSWGEFLRNSAVDNPIGAAAAGFLDTGGFGVPQMLAPEQYKALGEDHGVAMPLGQIGGAIGGTAVLNALGRNTIGRSVPALLAGGDGADFARNMAGDIAYSTIYGANTGQDPVVSALMGGIGSAAGQTVGKAAGKMVGGIDPGAAVARLRAQGITPTIGQIFRGRAAENGGRSFIAGLEDVVANTGAINSVVNSARNRALEDANLAAFNRVSGGSPVTAIGEQGVEQLGTISNQAYDDALRGVTVDQNDPSYISAMQDAMSAGRAIDASRGRGDFGYIIDNQLSPILGNQHITGENIQDALRLLQGQSRAYSKAATGVAPDPMASGVANNLDDVGTALTDLVSAQSPATLPALKNANAIYRGLNVLDDASARALNEGGTFTGAQLGQAIKANTRQFGGRGLSDVADSPLYQLQQDMTTVLPNQVPPTGVNAAPIIALTGLGATATGASTDNDYLTALGTIALASTPYTRVGQSAVARALLDRPELLRRIGAGISDQSGLAGTASIPLLIEP